MFCETCKINFDTDTGCCPLCHEKIGSFRLEDRLFPTRSKMITKKMFSLFSQIYFFISFIAVITTGIINYLSSKRFTWSAVILCALIYVYTLIKNAVLAKSQIALKMLLQAFLMSFMLYAIDYFLTNNSKWSLEFAIPFLLIAFNLSLTILAFSNKRKWREYVLSIFIVMLAGFVPFIFYLTKIISIYWPSLTAFLYSSFTILGMLIFYRKKFTNEIKKSFHI